MTDTLVAQRRSSATRFASPPASPLKHTTPLPLQVQHPNQYNYPVAVNAHHRVRARQPGDKRFDSSERLSTNSTLLNASTEETDGKATDFLVSDTGDNIHLAPRRASIEIVSGGRRQGSNVTFVDHHSSRSSSYGNIFAGEEENLRTPYRDRRLSESVVSLTGVLEEEEHQQSPTATPAVASSASRASPMVRSSSQRRISQEIYLGRNGLSSPRLVAALAGADTPVRRGGARSPAGVASGRSAVFPVANNASAVAIADEYFSQADTTALSDASPTAQHRRVPFPRSFSTSHADPNSARRIGRHLSLSGAQSSESIDDVPPSPQLNAIRPAGAQGRQHRYSSDLHIARPIFTTSRSEVSFDDRSRSRRSSEMGSMYTLDDSASMSGIKMTRDLSVKPSKHQLILTEDGKPDVILQLGNCIGRGQFGSVYRALNLNTGQMVAVKRIKHNNRSQDEVSQLMREVELLKSLVHPSVVKYEGLVAGDDVVSIVLEYVENGSLLHTLKAFGNFPEKLVASYVVKILEGLHYLHEMKVVHCDLKAANILTTKNGNVKLSDFGVSLNLKAAEDLKKNDAIGTPNWMAPEVIELKGASTAADIWSLGCTIIELLTGKPPYGDMLAMSAMWRIVEDDCPPLPDNISSTLSDFLTECFHKDPALRPSAAILSKHAWLHTTWSDNKALRPQDSVPFFKRVASSTDTRKGSVRKGNGGSDGKGTTGRSRQATVTQADVTPSVDGIDAQMERSVSTPSTAAVSVGALRPHLPATRAASAPDARSAKEIEDFTTSSAVEQQSDAAAFSMHSPTRVTMALSASPPKVPLHADARRGSDVTSTSTSFDIVRSPVGAFEQRGDAAVNGSAMDPNVLDLSFPSSSSQQDVFMLDEQANKAHAFVKSTFSKAVQCKICREAVKKHAVLCEECGLICHASCARRAVTACSLRAQLLMMASNQRSSMDVTRVMSPPPSTSTPPPNGVAARASSPPFGASPPLFRFPFGKHKRNSKTGSDLNLPATLFSSSPSATAVMTAVPIAAAGEHDGNVFVSPPLTPLTPTTPGLLTGEGEKAQKRRRRISLLPSHLSRRRSPSPSPVPTTPRTFVAPAAVPRPEPTSIASVVPTSTGELVRSLSSSHSLQDGGSLGYSSSASSVSSSFQLGNPASPTRVQRSSDARNSISFVTPSMPPQQQHVQMQAPPRGAVAARRQRHLSASAAQLRAGSTPNLIVGGGGGGGVSSVAVYPGLAAALSDGSGRPIPPKRLASHGAVTRAAAASSTTQFDRSSSVVVDREMSTASVSDSANDDALVKQAFYDQSAVSPAAAAERRRTRRVSKQDCVIA